MDKNEILVPILTAINDLREEVRENRKEIRKNSEEIQKNREAIQKNSEEIQKNREAIQKNSEEIQKNREAIQKNSKLIKKNSGKIDNNSKCIVSLEESIEKLEDRMHNHENESRRDRKAILEALCSYEHVTNTQYEENKKRIEKLEEQFKMISA